MVDPSPPAAVLDLARAGLVRRAKARRLMGVLLIALTIIGAPLAVVLGLSAPPGAIRGLVVGLGLLPAAVGALLVVAAHRDARAIVVLEPDRCVRALVVRWARPPDGCNVAVFAGSAERSGPPRAVFRLPVVAGSYEGEAWVCGADADPPAACVAVGDGGELIGAGRLVNPDVGQARWQRFAGRSAAGS